MLLITDANSSYLMNYTMKEEPSGTLKLNLGNAKHLEVDMSEIWSRLGLLAGRSCLQDDMPREQ